MKNIRGHGGINILAENLRSVNPLIANKSSMNTRRKMCWKCQKDKSPVGGHIKTFTGGPMKFICKECMDAKQTKE
jgi:hypothetical protein